MIVPNYISKDSENEAWVTSSKPTEILATYPDSILIVVINGNIDLLDKNKLNYARSDRFIIISSSSGLKNALEFGYKYAISNSWDLPIVRFDTTEHPWELSHPMAMFAQETFSTVCCDLIFPQELGLMPKHELLSDLRYRKLVQKVTKGKLNVGEAHGFIALCSKHINNIIYRASIIIETAENINNLDSGSIQWGFDLAILLASQSLELNVIRIENNGTLERNRPQEKCDDQYNKAKIICGAASQLYPNLFTTPEK